MARRSCPTARRTRSPRTTSPMQAGTATRCSSAPTASRARSWPTSSSRTSETKGRSRPRSTVASRGSTSSPEEGTQHMRKTLVFWLAVVAVLLAAAPTAAAANSEVRFATYNASLNRNFAGQLVADLSTPNNAQAATVAEIIQRARPDVLLINEFDFVADGLAAQLFQDNYLSVPHNGAEPIVYPFRFVAPSNTGIPSGHDFNNNGVVGGPDDAFGFGFFPGQFGMAVYSRYPIIEEDIRTFQNFLWKDMPGAKLPDDPATPAPQDWYSPAELAVFRLSSKSHWDVPVAIEGRTVHFLVSHPTPPVFDGAEDRNGTRNFDEIRFWADYITPGT